MIVDIPVTVIFCAEIDDLRDSAQRYEAMKRAKTVTLRIDIDDDNDSGEVALQFPPKHAKWYPADLMDYVSTDGWKRTVETIRKFPEDYTP